MTVQRPQRRAFVYTTAAAAGYFGLLATAMELSRSHGIELGQSGFLVLIALAALFGAPLAFGRFIARRTEISRVRSVALGALAGCLAVWVVPVVLFTLADPDGGAGPAVIAAVLAVMVGWCVAVAAGAGAYLVVRDRRDDSVEPG